MKKIDNLGRVVIPKEIRAALNIKSGDELNIELKSGKIIITTENFDDRIKRIKNKIEDVKLSIEDSKFPQEERFFKGYLNALNWLLEDIEKE